MTLRSPQLRVSFKLSTISAEIKLKNILNNKYKSAWLSMRSTHAFVVSLLVKGASPLGEVIDHYLYECIGFEAQIVYDAL